MSSTLYLSRRIIGEGQAYSESELLGTGRYVVVLAEPGAGKTELMGSFARQLGTSVTTASKFKYSVTPFSGGPLVIAGFDELAKIDATGIFTLLAKAEAASPTHLYLSSRSSEWSLSATNAFQQFIGHAPLVVRLLEFNDQEQQQIFDHHVEGESFSLFQRQVERFDLQHLLPNPQFLKLLKERCSLGALATKWRFKQKNGALGPRFKLLGKLFQPYGLEIQAFGQADNPFHKSLSLYPIRTCYTHNSNKSDTHPSAQVPAYCTWRKAWHRAGSHWLIRSLLLRQQAQRSYRWQQPRKQPAFRR
jgi:hypothetical protein